MVMLFNTAALPASPISGRVRINLNTNSDALGISPQYKIFSSNPASEVALDPADYSSFGSTPYSDAHGAGELGNLDFELNAAGLAAIAVGGTTKLGIRETEYDVANIEPAWTASQVSVFISSTGGSTLLLEIESVPAVTTGAASGVTHTTATLNGTLTDDGELATEVRFQYGPTAAYGTDTAWVAASEGAFLVDISGLTGGQTYHFRAQARNSEGTVNGADSEFSTLPVTALMMAFNQSIFTAAPTWTDVTDELMSLNVKRGRMHDLDRIEAGTAVFTLLNTSGNWWRYNSAAPVAMRTYQKPLTLVKLTVTYNSTAYQIFYGTVESIKPEWLTKHGLGAYVTIGCVDIFKSLSRFKIFSTGGGNRYDAELSGTRIGNVLDDLGWPAGLRDINSGLVQVMALANADIPSGGLGALEHLQQVAEAEGGLLFIGPDGKVVFRDHLDRQTNHGTAEATFSDDGADMPYALPELSDDDTFIYNEADIEGGGITPGAAHVVRSDLQAEQGARVWSRTDSLIDDDEDALDQAIVISWRYSDSVLRAESLLVLPEVDPANLYPKVLGYEISDRINLELDSTENPAEIDEDYHIEGIEHSWEVHGQWQTKWQLWDPNQFDIYRVGHGDWVQKVSNVSYADAHDAADADAPPNNDTDPFRVGQELAALGNYGVYRALVEFDTSGLDPAMTIEAAELWLYVTGAATPISNAFDLTVVSPGVAVDPLVVASFGVIGGQSTDCGHVNIAAAASTTAGWVIISLNASGLALINAGGNTDFGLRSSRDISSTSPGAVGTPTEYVDLDGVGSTHLPRLVIKYA
jgi:hypothetical protein